MKTSATRAEIGGLRPGTGIGIPTFGFRPLNAAFSLLEVMIAAAIFFMAVFAILGVVSSSIRNARALRRPTVDAGLKAAELSLTNKLEEGVDSGDFGDIYPDYTWTSDTYEVATNGLWQVDYIVQRRTGGQPVESKMSILLYPAGIKGQHGFKGAPTMRIHSPPPARAFTLIEILVAMAILSLVIAAIYASWTAIIRAAKLGQEVAAQVQRERVAARTIEQALSSTRSFAADLRHYSFVAENGSEATLSFVTRVPETFPRGGRFGDFNVRRVTFSVEGSPTSGRQLVMRQTPILMDMDEDEQQHPVVLATDLRAFEVGFWDLRKGEWTDEWVLTNQLPKLVRFTLKFGGSSPQSSRVQSEITRIVSLPSIMVPANWQVPGQPGRPGQPLPIPRNQLQNQ